jgi:Tol biopolymer transport system component
VAFQWRRPGQDHDDIYVKLVGASEPVRLTNSPANSGCAAWSPDGRSIAFLRNVSDTKTGLFLMPPFGGPERKLAEVARDPCEAWHPSGKWLVVTDSNSPEDPRALFSLSLETGEKRRLTSPPQNLGSDFFPAVSPGGEAMVFARGEWSTADLYLLELSEGLIPKGEPRRITFENRGSVQPAWAADGRAIVFCSGPAHSPELYKIAFSWPGWRPGKPQLLMFAGEGVRKPTISKQGRLAYSNFTIQANIWRLELNGGRPSVKPATKLIASTHLDHTPEYSPDGKRIAFASNRSGSHEIWVSNSDGSGAQQLTSFGGFYYVEVPHWSLDGRQIYFKSNAGGQPGNYVINSDGGQPKRLEGAGPDSWSRDGRWIYFTSKDEVWKRPAGGGNAIQITRKGGGYAHESTDGKFLYYLKDGNEFTSLWKVPVESGEETRVLESVCCLNFAVVDRGIYFIPDPQGQEHSTVQFLTFATGKVLTIAALTGFPAYGSSVSPDGQWLLYSQYEPKGSDLSMVENFQ